MAVSRDLSSTCGRRRPPELTDGRRAAAAAAATDSATRGVVIARIEAESARARVRAIAVTRRRVRKLY